MEHAPLDDADALDDAARWGRRPVRGGSGSGGSRRDARAGSARRRGPLLLAAAAVLAVVAVTGSVKLLGRNSSSGASLSAGTAQSSQSASPGAEAGAAPAPAPIVRSGRDYHASTLAADASALFAAASGAKSTATAGGQTSGASGAGEASRRAASPHAAAPEVSAFPGARVAPDPSATDITNPARLAACLAALGAAPNRLVAVDLARYEGREAAILLLTAAEGSGHEVWAVERTCAPGAEGALKYTRMTH